MALTQFPFSGIIKGKLSKIIMTAKQEILVIILGLLEIFLSLIFLLIKITDVNTDKPIEEKIITEIEANNSNLIKAAKVRKHESATSLFAAHPAKNRTVPRLYETARKKR